MWRSLDFAIPNVKLFTDPLRFALANVKLESLTLRGHRMTFSHSSKESLRPLTQRDKVDEEFSHSTKESLRPLTQRDKVDEEFSHSSKGPLRPLTQRDKVDEEELRLLGGCRGVICRVPGYIRH